MASNELELLKNRLFVDNEVRNIKLFYLPDEQSSPHVLARELNKFFNEFSDKGRLIND